MFVPRTLSPLSSFRGVTGRTLPSLFHTQIHELRGLFLLVNGDGTTSLSQANVAAGLPAQQEGVTKQLPWYGECLAGCRGG